MSFSLRVSLPTSGHSAREFINDETLPGLVEILSPDNRARIPTLRQALAQGRDFLANSNACSVNIVCIKADGSVVLQYVGPRGGHRTLWKFGTAGH